MIRNIVIVLLVAIIAFILSRYEAGQIFENDIEQTKSTIENIYQAETPEESQKFVEEHNARAKQEMVILKQRAKSSASIKFLELTEQQNRHADDTTLYTSQLIPLSKSMENMDPGSSDPALINEKFTDFCTIHGKYLVSLESVQKILNEKIDMVDKHPEILQEIVGGTPEQREQVKSVMQQLLYNQSNMLFQEQQYHMQLQCPGYLANLNGKQPGL